MGIAGAERLRGQARRRHAKEAEPPENEIEHDGGGIDGAEKMRFAEPADHRGVGKAEERCRDVRKRHRQRDAHDRAMRDFDARHICYNNGRSVH